MDWNRNTRVEAIRDALWCLIAFGLIACAATPLPDEKPAGMRVNTRAHEARQAATAAELEALHPARTERGIVFTFGDASFDLGRAELKEGAVRSLGDIAQFLHEHPERRVLIESFTDSNGSNASNIELSQSRADAVAMLLIQRGIDARRLAAIGFGARFPVANEIDAAGRERNRRVEVIVTRGADAIPYRVIPAAL